ncbi:MAG: aryl-sulfate sulfotransferase, partial [candidate division WOR-3 bacterium]
MGAASSGLAQPEPWMHPDGTVHYFHAVAVPCGLNWAQALDSARAPGGYLATLTSQDENDMVFRLVDSVIFWRERPEEGVWVGPWLGGLQPAGSPEPGGNWLWITRQHFDWTNWSPGKPDNYDSDNRLVLGGQALGRSGTWDDRNGNDSNVPGFVLELSCETTTVGLTRFDSSATPGFVLFSPIMSYYTFLVDRKGRVVHQWVAATRGVGGYELLGDGMLLRCAFVPNPLDNFGGRVEKLDWDGRLVWGYDYADSHHVQHHDAIGLPNGNVLLLARELKTRSEVEAAGRDPSRLIEGRLLPDCVIEVDPSTDSIVWEWHVWDHLIQDFDSTKANYGDVAAHPELVDINYLGLGGQYGIADWNHSNSLDYNPQFDQILISVRNFSEVWVIDHSTTTEQARGHTGGRLGMGGDIVYRWGNPQAYRAGDSASQILFGQHNARWIRPGLPGAGHILVFNNGYGRSGGEYSTVDEFIPESDSAGCYPRPARGQPFGPGSCCWRYGATPARSLYSPYISGAQRLPGGNTLVCNGGEGLFLEVTPDSQVVWTYVNPWTVDRARYQSSRGPGDDVFRVSLYPPEYS